MYHYRRMKVKTSITLSEDVIAAIDRLTRGGSSRSETIERLLKQSLAAEARRVRDRKDLEIINVNAETLNEEAVDVLTYQVEI